MATTAKTSGKTVNVQDGGRCGNADGSLTLWAVRYYADGAAKRGYYCDLGLALQVADALLRRGETRVELSVVASDF